MAANYSKKHLNHLLPSKSFPCLNTENPGHSEGSEVMRESERIVTFTFNWILC